MVRSFRCSSPRCARPGRRSRIGLKTREFTVHKEARGESAREAARGWQQEDLSAQLNGIYETVIVFLTILLQMSSVLGFRETLEVSNQVNSWLARFSVSNSLLMASLNFISGHSVRVGAMPEAVRADVGTRIMGDCVWACLRVGLLSSTLQSEEGVLGGCSFCVQGALDGGSKSS